MTVVTRFASGRKAKAQCGRCGDVVPYRRLRQDGYKRGYWVCDDCYDPAEPQERPINTADAVALRHPAPLLDSGTTDAVQDLTDALDGGSTFGVPGNVVLDEQRRSIFAESGETTTDRILTE